MKTTNDQISKEGLLSEELMKQILETKDESLDLSNCENLKVLPKLSTQIKKLSLLNCSRLESVENLAEMKEITSLDLTNCRNLISPILPEGITHLILAGCENLKVLPKLPKGLTYLDLSDWEIQELPELPKGVDHLIFAGCENLEVLPELPKGLTYLDLSGCENLEVLPELPKGLTYLDLSSCENLKVLPELPKGLTYLDLSGCENLEGLLELPRGLTHLDLFGWKKLAILPPLPDTLTYLNLADCENLKVLPELPKGLTYLDLSGCYGLEVLPELPKGLARLSLSGCENLEVLPKLPEALTSLDLSGCYNLEALPKLPEALIFLDLSGCSKIEYKEETINRIKKLEEKGCIVTYPEQFDPDFRKTSENLEKAIKSYQEMPKPTFVRELLWHYLTREVPHRGGLADLIESTKPFLELVSKEPKNLKWADQIASLYLEGCVNQPVIGWSEISACVSIAEAPTTIEKIEASKHLATTILIKSFICDLKENQKPAQDYEAEFANALLREVYKKLHDEKKIDTKKPWYAMPENIVYEHYIENFLTAKLVDKACKKINEHIFSNEKLANILINNYSENWGQIAFPQELKQIKDKYDERMIKGEKVDKERQEEIDNTISKLTLQALTSEVSSRSTFGKRPGEGGCENCDLKRVRG